MKESKCLCESCCFSRWEQLRISTLFSNTRVMWKTNARSGNMIWKKRASAPEIIRIFVAILAFKQKPNLLLSFTLSFYATIDHENGHSLLFSTFELKKMYLEQFSNIIITNENLPPLSTAILNTPPILFFSRRPSYCRPASLRRTSPASVTCATNSKFLRNNKLMALPRVLIIYDNCHIYNKYIEEGEKNESKRHCVKEPWRQSLRMIWRKRGKGCSRF